MTKIPMEIEKLATGIAVGSIFCLGVFLIIDAFEPKFAGLFEKYVGTASFGVIAAMPMLAFLYVTGSLLTILSDFVFQRCNSYDYEMELGILVHLAEDGNETINTVFADLYRKKEDLRG